uniref:Guanylate cyclase domain-containing protein n=1 Tax=Panagrolaimus superbus TaxID=310955 RepID=A0A914Y6C2_9BILA
MQSNCPPNQIQMSETTAKQLMEVNEYNLTKRGIVHVKGKGDVNTYWLNEHIHEPHDNIAVHAPQYAIKPQTAAKASFSTANSIDRNNNISNQKNKSSQPSTVVGTSSFSPINSELEPLIDPTEK